MKSIKKVISVILCVLVFGCSAGCQREEKMKEKSYPIEILSEFKGEEITTLPLELQDYLYAETVEQQLFFLTKYSDLPFYKDDIRFLWNGDNSTSYTVHFSESEDFYEEITFKTYKEYLFDSGKFVPGKKYYWKVTGTNENSQSKTDSFVYSDKPVRIIEVEGSHNVRDLGGWKTVDGKTVKFNKLIRGGRINGIGEEGKQVLKDDLKIRTELDLRGSHDDGGQNSCIFDETANYIKVDLKQYTYILPGFYQEKPKYRKYDEETPQKIRTIFDCLKDENNYPIYFHCNAGADRTGTLAFLINGVLGVPYEDLVKDFELTSFSVSGRRWRGDIDKDMLEVTSDVMQDDSGNYVAFDKMYNGIINNFSTSEGTLSSAIENYLVNICKVNKEDIEKVRKIMLI